MNPDPPALLRSVKELVAHDSDCSFSVTIVLPNQQNCVPPHGGYERLLVTTAHAGCRWSLLVRNSEARSDRTRPRPISG
jgi:hypothetical protein